jgi:hypothetical protein
LYLLNVYETWSFTQTDEVWRDLYRSRGGVTFDSINSITALLQRFAPFIKGGVSYDPTRYFSNFTGQSFRWQGEYAALIGGLTDRLPVPPDLASPLGLALDDSVLVEDFFDGDSAVWVPGKVDAPALPWNSTSLTEEERYLRILSWGVETLLPRCHPSKLYIREITDFTVQQRMFQVNLAGTDDLDLNSMPAARAEILERILTFLHSNNPSSIFHIYGWIRPEPMTQWFAFFGSSFHETLLGNLSWHSAFRIPERSFVPPAGVNPRWVNVEEKYYVLFVGSEGDASNWHFGFQSGAWLSPERGSVPVGWGWNLHLFDLCPFVAAYYYDTATPNDGFLSVTSPLGYAYPDLWESDVWQGAIDSTRSLMEKFGVRDVYGYKHYAGSGTMVYRGKTISNSFNFPRYGQFQQAVGAPLTLLFDPQIASQTPVTSFGPLMFNHVGDGSFYGNASDLNAMAQRIVTNLKKQTRPGFLLAGYQRFRQDAFSSRTDPSDADISLPRLVELVRILQADTSVGSFIEVVTPERFSALLRRKLGLVPVEGQDHLPRHVVLAQNYPNPFNPTTTIEYAQPVSGSVRLAVYDILGREVAVLADGWREAGSHRVVFDGSGLAGGAYFCRLQLAAGVRMNRMMLRK